MMDAIQIESLVRRAQEIEQSQTKHPWPGKAMSDFCRIQSELADSAPKVSGENSDLASALVSTIYVDFIGRSNGLPADLLANVFAAIINYVPPAAGVNEIRISDHGYYHLLRNGERTFTFQDKNKAVNCFRSMIGAAETGDCE